MLLAKPHHVLLGILTHSTQSSQWPAQVLVHSDCSPPGSSPVVGQQEDGAVSSPTRLPHSPSVNRISGCPRFLPGLASVGPWGVAQSKQRYSLYKGQQRLSNIILSLGSLHQETPFQMILFEEMLNEHDSWKSRG